MNIEKRPSILIVDDDLVLRETLNLLLARSYQVLAAASANNAFEILENTNQESFPEVALIDLMMPGVDGLALLELLRQRFPQLPVIMLTASDSVSSVVRAMKIGASDYLVKPFETEELLFRLNEVRTLNKNNVEKNFTEQSNEFEKQKIIEALRKTDFIQTKAAKELGITRRMLKYRMDKLGIS